MSQGENLEPDISKNCRFDHFILAPCLTDKCGEAAGPVRYCTLCPGRVTASLRQCSSQLMTLTPAAATVESADCAAGSRYTAAAVLISAVQCSIGFTIGHY